MGKFSKCDYCGDYEETKWGESYEDSFICQNCFEAYRTDDIPNPVLPATGEQISFAQAIAEGLLGKDIGKMVASLVGKKSTP